ncbi:four helix bundle protein [Zobellia galactanivorans]|uniref:23S ribosomal protein n=1 Tax=Zobellia galactanivorans (strain DSM 12802 / CCUG 47099 / CIP 106680 / NCIMB 13871 / Dsij) TaxID=63186 RepID=G0L075_ZOBGA|nr:four helix bundle protein [Zobellia galactanivorans]MBU3027197.1 four helix bundle protein [Zobellia galactanivorans]MDO6807872.1 four helix bundle protein [Zobellia galactanivorans]CAZ94170.1 23S ribosomal protein [Zobellia galactanivorans]
MHKVENLKIWKKAIELAKSIYLLAADLPSEEKYGLVSQIKRCSVSIPSNIAEGAGRNSQKEFKHFLSIANGSAYELQTQLILLIELNLIKKEKVKPVIDVCVEIQKMNYSFQKTL